MAFTKVNLSYKNLIIFLTTVSLALKGPVALSLAQLLQMVEDQRKLAPVHPGRFCFRQSERKVGSMSITAHLAMLQERHSKLESVIGEESHRPAPDFGLLQTLKKQKLLLKEEMERLRYGRERLDAA